MTDQIEPHESGERPDAPDPDPTEPGTSAASPDASPGAGPWTMTPGEESEAESPLLAPAGLPHPASSPGSAAGARPVPTLLGRRQFARTTPVVVDRGRASFGFPSLGDRRQLGQIGLVVLMVAALGAILFARLGQPASPGLGSAGSPSPNPSLHASPRATPHATSATSIGPGPSASARATTPVPSPTSKPQTYKVKSGDTLSSIAAKFHTTTKIIEQLNNLTSPFVIHPGEILKLP